MKPRILPFLILTVAVLSLGACASEPQPMMSEPVEAPSFVGQADVEGEMVVADEAMESTGRSSGLNVNLEDRLVIQNANLELIVVDPAESAKKIGEIAEEAGGFVVTLNVFRTTFEDGTPADQAYITIRVPSDLLSEVLDEIKSDAIDVQMESISGQDVTQDYTDLQSQLRNLEAVEEELREIMGTMTRAEDVLDVYEHLIQIRNEIEIIRGRMQYLEQSSSLSAITVQLIPDIAAKPLQIGRWQPAGTAKAAIEATLSALQLLAQLAIWIVLFVLPILLILTLVVWVIVKVVKSIRNRRSGDDTVDDSSS